MDRKAKFRGGKLTESPPVRIAGIVRRLTQPHMGDRSFGGLPPERQRFVARQALRERKSDEAYQDWLRQLRDKTYVEIRLEEK